MKDMSIIANKKIINKETNEVRLVVSIDEENRKIHSVPVDEPNAEPSIMAAASYDRRWKLYEKPEVNHDEPMKMSDVVTKLESLFDILNRVYFDNVLPKPVITVQSTPKAYGHCSTKKIWKSENDGQYEINIGAEFLNRPSANTAATMCHEMVHLYCLVNEIQDTCQKGRYHNKTFKAEAEARDLEIGYDRTVGFSHTNPTEAFKKTLEDNGFVLEVPFARVMPEEKAKSPTATFARSAGRKLRRPPTSFAVSVRPLWRELTKRTPEWPVSRPKVNLRAPELKRDTGGLGLAWGGLYERRRVPLQRRGTRKGDNGPEC